jgi:hypothetical protein
MTSSIFKMFGTDVAREKTGVWNDYGDIRFLVARAGGSNIAFSEAYKAKVRPFRHQIDRGTLSKTDDDNIMAELYAETVIKSVEIKDDKAMWVRGLPTPNGEVVSYSVAGVKQLLLELPDLFRDIRECATDTQKYLKEAEEADAKNS